MFGCSDEDQLDGIGFNIDQSDNVGSSNINNLKRMVVLTDTNKWMLVVAST